MQIDIGEISGTHPTLSELLVWLEETTGLSFTITSQGRPGDPGVHGTTPTRAHDLRNRSQAIGEVIAKHINDNWTYDRLRPHMKCALLHGEGSHLHLHVQVHPNTIRG